MASPWVIQFNTPEMKQPIKLRFDGQLIIGRRVEDDPQTLDVDLSPYNAAELGVSRQHVRIYSDSGSLMIEDLNSSNGTSLNDTPLDPYTPAMLDEYAELTLGKFPLELQLIKPDSEQEAESYPSKLQGHGEKVMIVEDDPEVSKVLQMTLQRAGYEPIEVKEVVSAIRVYNRVRPQAIVLDLMLPDMNGIEFCRYVRRDTFNNTAPIIVVTALSDITRPIKEAGADILMRKPLDVQELRQHLGDLLQKQRTDYNARQKETSVLKGTTPLDELDSNTPARNSAVIYVSGHSESPITINVEDAVSFGRGRSPRSLDNHIDLSPYEAIDLGVSRMHMQLYCSDGMFTIEDMNSTNGTYINGELIPTRTPIPIKSGDEVQLGDLRMYIYFFDEG